MEYVKVRARQDPNDRVALVFFSNETRFVVHPITMQAGFTIQQYGDEVTLRGSTHIGKGLRGVVRVFKRQRKSNHQRHVILLTDNWGGDAVKKAKKLELKYDAVIHVVVIGQAKVNEDKAALLKIATNEPGGNIHWRYVKDAEGLIEHFRRLAAGGDNKERKQGQG
jgi:Mg-chelatase subunit ChlD